LHIVQPYARLMPPPHINLANGWTGFTLKDGIELVRRVEWCARISHRTEEKQTDDSYARFLQTWVMDHGDFSTIEHCNISADLVVDRGLSHELVRHRLAKILDLDIDVGPPEVTQESTRFVNYGKKGGSIGVVLPPELVDVHEMLMRHANAYGPPMIEQMIVEAEIVGMPPNQREAHKLSLWYPSWIQGVVDAEHQYLEQLSWGVAPELARDMLPHCTATRMVMTHNLRNWRHLLLMRSTNETHRKLRPLMINLLGELQEKVPILFTDIQPNIKQSISLSKMR
jgi:thymidylate synthase (FAD)